MLWDVGCLVRLFSSTKYIGTMHYRVKERGCKESVTQQREREKTKCKIYSMRGAMETKFKNEKAMSSMVSLDSPIIQCISL